MTSAPPTLMAPAVSKALPGGGSNEAGGGEGGGGGGGGGSRNDNVGGRNGDGKVIVTLVEPPKTQASKAKRCGVGDAFKPRPLREGDDVIIVGPSQPELDGLLGTLLKKKSSEADEWLVRLKTTEAVVVVQQENLDYVNTSESNYFTISSTEHWCSDTVMKGIGNKYPNWVWCK